MISPTNGVNGAGGVGGMDPFQLLMMMLGQMQPQQAGNFMGNLAQGTGLENNPTMNSIVDKCKSGQQLDTGDRQFLQQNADTLSANMPNGGRF